MTSFPFLHKFIQTSYFYEVGECLKSSVLCTATAICVDIALGSYRCQCLPGFKAIGDKCEAYDNPTIVAMKFPEMDFHPNLNNPVSQEFQELQETINTELKKLYPDNLVEAYIDNAFPPSVTAFVGLVFETKPPMLIDNLKAAVNTKVFHNVTVDRDSIRLIKGGVSCSSAPCSPNATCVDLEGQFNCTCNEGYLGNGTFCEGYVEVNASISIVAPFEEELLNKSSPQYKMFVAYVTRELTKVFDNDAKFSSVIILGLRNGSSSVDIDYLVTYRSNTPTTRSREVAAVTGSLEIGGSDGSLEGLQLKKYSINEPPPPPSPVSTQNVKQTELLLKWTPPDLSHVFSITSYHIEYHIVGETSLQKAKTASSESNILLSNLKSDTFYNIFVLCENKFGKGERSQKVNVKTMKENGGNETTVIIVVTVAVVLFAVAFIIGCLIARHRRSRNKKDSSNNNKEYGKQVVSYGSRPYPADWAEGNQQEMYYINEVQSEVRSNHDNNDDDVQDIHFDGINNYNWY